MHNDDPHAAPADFRSGIREFRIDGDVWIARLAGGGAAGSGAFGLAYIESIEFAPAATPNRPVREALVQRGRFDLLQDDELRALFAAAPPLSKRRTLEDTN